MGYLKSALIGTGWMGALRILTRGLGLVKTAILARLLTPTDFGLFGIAAITLAFLETFTETGVSLALVQQEEDIDEYVSSAWVISILRGLFISAVILLASRPIAVFFQQPRAASLVMLIALLPIIKGFINPAAVEFVKKLHFEKEFLLRSIPILIEMGIAIPASVMTRSATAIIFGMIGAAFAEVILSFKMARVRPLLKLSPERARKVINYGKWVNLGGITEFLASHFDDIVVGKFLGTPSLGVYQMAYKLSILPSGELAETVSKVSLPIYVKIASDRFRLRKAVMRTTKTLTAIAVPASLALILFPRFIIELTLGDQWLGAVAPLRILSVFGLLLTLSQAPSAALFASGRPDIPAKLRALQFAVLALLLLVLVPRYQLVGVALAAVVSAAVAHVPLWMQFAQLIRCPAEQLTRKANAKFPSRE